MRLYAERVFIIKTYGMFLFIIITIVHGVFLDVLIVNGFDFSLLWRTLDSAIRINYVFELVTREEWRAKQLPTGRQLASANVIYVLLYQTATHGCSCHSACVAFMQNYQVSNWYCQSSAHHNLSYKYITINIYNKKFIYSFIVCTQNAWQQRNGSDIPFNYMIGGDGRVYEARGWAIESDQTPIRSDFSLSIAFIGMRAVPSSAHECRRLSFILVSIV